MKFALNVMHDGVMFSIEDDVPEDFNEDAAAILKDLGAISEEEVVVEEEIEVVVEEVVVQFA